MLPGWMPSLPAASSSVSGRHPLQASVTSHKKPVAKSEVLCRRPHLVAKSGKAIPAKDDWQVATPSLPELPGITTLTGQSEEAIEEYVPLQA